MELPINPDLRVVANSLDYTIFEYPQEGSSSLACVVYAHRTQSVVFHTTEPVKDFLEKQTAYLLLGPSRERFVYSLRHRTRTARHTYFISLGWNLAVIGCTPSAAGIVATIYSPDLEPLEEFTYHHSYLLDRMCWVATTRQNQHCIVTEDVVNEPSGVRITHGEGKLIIPEDNYFILCQKDESTVQIINADALSAPPVEVSAAQLEWFEPECVLRAEDSLYDMLMFRTAGDDLLWAAETGRTWSLPQGSWSFLGHGTFLVRSDREVYEVWCFKDGQRKVYPVPGQFKTLLPLRYQPNFPVELYGISTDLADSRKLTRHFLRIALDK